MRIMVRELTMIKIRWLWKKNQWLDHEQRRPGKPWITCSNYTGRNIDTTSKMTSLILGMEEEKRWINLVQAIEERAKLKTYATVQYNRTCAHMFPYQNQDENCWMVYMIAKWKLGHFFIFPPQILPRLLF